MMKYEGAEFVEFLRRVLDFPRKGKLNPDNPHFEEVLNEHVAQAAGRRIPLKPEIFYNLERKTTKKISVPWYATTKRKQPEYSPTSKKRTEAKDQAPLGPEKTALDGTKPYLAGGPFTDSKAKLRQEDCCYCWNNGKPCKYLSNDGSHCRKLHVCMHQNCRTLFHHGHRARDHNPQRS